jgi:hypothetical protein
MFSFFFFLFLFLFLFFFFSFSFFFPSFLLENVFIQRGEPSIDLVEALCSDPSINMNFQSSLLERKS